MDEFELVVLGGLPRLSPAVRGTSDYDEVVAPTGRVGSVQWWTSSDIEPADDGGYGGYWPADRVIRILQSIMSAEESLSGDAVADTGGAPDGDGSGMRVIAHRYQVVRVLGVGSSARTLLCNDVREARKVAVKELRHGHLEDWKYLELFEREARLLAMLDHPGIPKVFDFFRGQDRDASLYLVQEYVDGTSLKQRMESGPFLGEQEVYELALGLLDVLEYLHGRAPPILHRDIKPSNVLLRVGRGPALVDFGGVCIGWRPPDASGTTVVGTIGYMPPEQLLGQAGPSSDLYALGATLLHVLTGVAPYEFPFQSGRIEVPPDLPARRPLRQAIEAVLRPAPRDRPQTAADMRSILLDERPAATLAREVRTGTRSLVARRAGRVISGDGPQFVDMGQPPRDPKGEFADVYHNLMHPAFPTTRLHSSGVQTLIAVGYGLLSVVSLGIIPLVYYSKVRDRKRRYSDLFCHGSFTEGWIVSLRGGDILSGFLFEFEVGDVTYRGFTEYATAMRRYWSEGDTVAVLYDPENPSRCCFVHR